MGFTWNNPQIIKEATDLGQKGNVIARYKAIKDLENSNKIYDLEFYLDSAMISDIITEQCDEFNVPAIDYTMNMINGEIVITDGQIGYELDVFASVDHVLDFFYNEWEKGAATVDLVIAVDEPRGSYEELSQLTDVLGTFSTNYSSSNSNRKANIVRGTDLCSGHLLYPGEEFDMLNEVTPFNSGNGYELAGSFLDGMLVDSFGGGICQVSTTLYNALLLAEMEITERYEHSMIISYVPPSFDAAIAESSGKDLKFVNNSDHPIYIDGHTANRNVTFTIYGKETRPANREITYENQILETTYPDTERVIQDAGSPVGFISIQSAHIGYKSRLWKIVKVDGVEVERVQINSSTYKVTPRTATVGIFTEDGAALAEIYAAIETNNIDHIRNVAAALSPHVAPPADEQPIEDPVG
jgi:vancomycin resistance protein YoaR